MRKEKKKNQYVLLVDFLLLFLDIVLNEKKIRRMIPSSGHTCDGGNRTLNWSQFCDGIFDCRDRFDEEGRFCSKFQLIIYTPLKTLNFKYRTLYQQSLSMST